MSSHNSHFGPSQSLPIDEVLGELRTALHAPRQVILQAPPGAGKSTRVPLALLDEPWLAGKRIIMLEPRRIAARNVATYMAQCLGEKVGETVGYRMRLDTRVGKGTRIEVVTEGVLTRMLQHDPALEQAGLVIFDEFHERSLHADLGLALALDAQDALRDDLRILIMSATLESEPLRRMLDDPPVVISAGRAHPVSVHYLGKPDSRRIDETVVSAIRKALREEPGSVLVFLPGAGEIRRVQNLLAAAQTDANVQIMPLYGDLSFDRQEAAILPAGPGMRKVVLATSIAETSLTIEGVRVVIDAGLRRVPRFDPRSGMTGLITATVTQSAAEQRRGRAGRTEPGVCYRLWSEAEQARLTPHTGAEILEADLAPVVLELALWGALDITRLRWLDAPPVAAIAQASDLLQRLGAIGAEGRPTPHGRAMAELPVHPRLAHMILKGKDWGCAALACDMAALLGERDPLRGRAGARSADLRSRLLALHAASDSGDHDRNLLQRIGRQADMLRQRVGVRDDKGGPDMTGVLLACAYPDRVAQRRGAQDLRYRLASGRGAQLAQVEELALSEYLAAAELDANEREARIHLAAPVTLADLERFLPENITECAFVAWDEQSGSVRMRRQRRFGELVLSDMPHDNPDAQDIERALMEGIRGRGLGVLPWSREARSLQARILFLRRVLGTDWPDVSDEALLATLETWLLPYVQGMNRLDHLARLDIGQIVLSLLEWHVQQQLDALAPTHLAVPTGSRIRIDYDQATPVLAVRLQEVFGLQETPRIAGGRVPVTLHLLSPAMRPVQITQDLASFWNNTYQEVKKDLKGRYPRHYWPDDPLQAEPVKGTRRRKS